MLYIYCRYNPEHHKQDDFAILLQKVASLSNVEIFYDEWIDELQNDNKEDFYDFVQRADLMPIFEPNHKSFCQWKNGNYSFLNEYDLAIKHIVEKEDYEDHECLLVQNYEELIYIICDDQREEITSFAQIACCSTFEQLNEWFKNHAEVDARDVNARLPISETALNQRSRFNETDMISIQGTRIYKELRTNYLLHLDNFHKKEDAHIEVYRKDWTFIGTYDLQCETLTPCDKKKKNRKLRIKNL